MWNGTAWSDVTRPYGERPAPTRFAPTLELVQALRRIVRTGIIGVLGGLGLLVSVLAHWPGTANPAPRWFAVVASEVAVALLVVGSVVCAFGVRELQGRWSLEAFVPGLNLFVASALVTRRLGSTRRWRTVYEIALLLVFAVASRSNLWLCAGPVLVAYVETSWFAALIDQLSGPSTIEKPDAS